MLAKILGQAKTSAVMKKLRGGPQSLLPMSPAKGSGVKRPGWSVPKQMKGYVTPRQNPVMSPRTGGLVSPWRLK